ncbi:hypothetical protein F5876DRAFT_66231 [Lentinula aff. lateritia]|uniref:Uncharacterized protein n=1 Tax=Lentinula aff. lateritia TaxID=2804960 RepID=A0ACC1TY94_9AGAR|nr:hypothetical protein F5876DRAFT_66231 [Lentinula aff. lateritia]
MPIIYGENQSHAKWSYETGVTSRPFRPRLFGIIVDIKSSAKDLGDNGVDEYPNEQHDMVSGNYYNQLLSLREQMYKDVEESNMVTGLQSEVQGGPAKPFALASTILSKGWHPGYIEIGAFIEAVVELQRIDHLRKTPFTMYYNVIAHQIMVLAHDVDFSISSAVRIARPAEVQDEIIAYWDPIVLAKFAWGASGLAGTWTADTGLIVAGISVLNFFIHALFPLPLNTFCHIDHCLSVGIWYIAKEYTYRPQQGQQSTFQMDLIRVKELLRKSRSDDVDDTMDFQRYVDVTPSDQQQLHIIYFSRHGYTFFDMPLIAMTINPDTVLSFLCTCSVGDNIYESKFEYVIAPQLWDSTIAKLNILTINNEASRPSTSPVPKVSLTLSIPDDVFKPEQQNGFENWLNMFKASSIFFAIDVLQ